MGGHLWGGLAVVCVCVLVAMTGDADQHTPWDKGRPARPRSPPPRTWRLAPRASEVKLKSREEGPPVEEQGRRRVRRDGEGTLRTDDPTTVATTTTAPTTTTATVTTSVAITTTPTTTTAPTTTTITITTPNALPTTTTTLPTTTTTIPTTTPTTTTTTTRPTTTNAGQCQNGATWDGIKCRCPEGFYGTYCEMPVCQNGGTWVDGLCQCPQNFQGTECQYFKETIEVQEEVTVNATVEMKAKVENRNFTEDLTDKSSPAFQDFEKEFKEQMREVYKNIEGYQDVVIHELSQGSIVVNYSVILKVLATTAASETVENISKNLVSAFDNYTSCNENCQGHCSFCFNPTFTSVTKYEVPEVETSVCTSYVPADFQSFYFPLVTSTGVICVTRCDRRSADPYRCVHGTCFVTRSGPECQCSDRVAFWYQDKLCSSRISKMGVAAGVPVAALVVVIVIFTIVVARARRQKGKDRQTRHRGDHPVLSPTLVPPQRNKGTSGLDLYCNVDEKWNHYRGFTISNPGASWEAMETSRTNIKLERVDTSQKIHIQRPTHIVTP